VEELLFVEDGYCVLKGVVGEGGRGKEATGKRGRPGTRNMSIHPHIHHTHALGALVLRASSEMQ